MPKKVLIIANSGPEDPCRATVPFLTAKACVERGMDVSIWLYNNSVYLVCEGVAEHIQAAGLPVLEDLLLFLTLTKPIPIYIGISCAVGRGLLDANQGHKIPFDAGELAGPPKLAELIEEADRIINF
jgi:predicted peroxiredoxin